MPASGIEPDLPDFQSGAITILAQQTIKKARSCEPGFRWFLNLNNYHIEYPERLNQPLFVNPNVVNVLFIFFGSEEGSRTHTVGL